MTLSRQSSNHPCIHSVVVFTMALLLMTGCAEGPNFKEPAAPKVSSYTVAPPATTVGTTNVVGGQAQHFVEGMDIPGEWWTLFHSQTLNDLIERALTNNPNIMAAQAALAVARENTSAQKGTFWPGVNGGFSTSRQEQSDVLSPALNYPAVTTEEFEYDLFTPEVSVSYVPDVFGLNRRTVESLQAQEEQQRFALVATYITLSANVVAAAIQEASLRAQIEATRRVIAINTEMLQILRNQFAHGYASRLAVAAQESQLAQAEAALPPLLAQLDQQHDLLAVLAGDFPGGDLSEKFELSDLQLPEELPVSLPSKLVEQRPDVRQAEENLHSASAQIGIAIANRLPNITLTANAGSTALTLDKVFSSDTGFWGIGAAATAPLFEGGALMHKERAAKAAYVQAAEQYRSIVLTAFQNVADTLNALEHDGDAVTTAAAAADAAKVTLDITRQQLQTGYTNYLAALSAELAYQQAVITLAQAQANRYADTAALFQALGGGWWNRADAAREASPL
jgi:NodT family efflux transporter outer membrane factor (OMF) lipoprotein